MAILLAAGSAPLWGLVFWRPDEWSFASTPDLWEFLIPTGSVAALILAVVGTRRPAAREWAAGAGLVVALAYAATLFWAVVESIGPTITLVPAIVAGLCLAGLGVPQLLERRVGRTDPAAVPGARLVGVLLVLAPFQSLDYFLVGWDRLMLDKSAILTWDWASFAPGRVIAFCGLVAIIQARHARRAFLAVPGAVTVALVLYGVAADYAHAATTLTTPVHFLAGAQLVILGCGIALLLLARTPKGRRTAATTPALRGTAAAPSPEPATARADWTQPSPGREERLLAGRYRLVERIGSVGVLHRDVKPANAMVDDEGRVVLTDFGIAARADDTSLTLTGGLIGTPGYIAPERLNGDADGPAGDLWSLGATMYHLVEGRGPYRGTSPAAVIAAVLTAHPAPPVLAGPLAPVLLGLLARDPADRWPPDRVRTELTIMAGTG
ncbi:hypothetical protein Acor_67120 [Acrocarpospora corrugata]|uniref:Protein kinase domain-containing protein n=2 Tax=Acrocarpospora corrugata TaxID=35763 RepID=A0A5M3W750_9ACTN|nr:hypothetical protein Acor_67120 [Acrocarpospora corrugata]